MKKLILRLLGLKTETYKFEKTVSEVKNSENLHKIMLEAAKHVKERTVIFTDNYGNEYESIEVYIEVVK